MLLNVEVLLFFVLLAHVQHTMSTEVKPTTVRKTKWRPPVMGYCYVIVYFLCLHNVWSINYNLPPTYIETAIFVAHLHSSVVVYMQKEGFHFDRQNPLMELRRGLRVKAWGLAVVSIIDIIQSCGL